MPKTTAPTRAASRREQALEALVQSSFVTIAVMSRIAAEHELSLTQLRLLGILRDRRVRITGLGERLGLEKSTMSGLIDRAEKRGLVERAPSPEDGRVTEVFLTKEGARLVEELRADATVELGPLVDRLTPAEQQRVQELLLKMTDP
jgi:DNA-binding MarR family transcriptional regulator